MAFNAEEHPFWFYFTCVIGGILGWCFLAHCLFMRCCTCLKRKHKLNEETFLQGATSPFRIMSAHRGGSAERMENTMSAFQHALDLGMNLLELDVHCTKDGEVLVAHDADLGRMCGQMYEGRRISEFNYADLPPFQKTVSMHLSPGDYTMPDDENPKWTLLKDLFAQCPADVMISIDMKDANNTICEKVNELVKEYKREDVTVWGSMFKTQHEMV